MQVLVTGASGFIGRWTIAPLLKRGAEVHVISRTGSAPAGCTGHRCDLLDRAEVEQCIAAIKPSHLLHLAWIATPGAYWTSLDNLDWVAASISLCRSFVVHGGKRMVVAGTCAEYDWSQSMLDEQTTPCVPTSLYGVAKDALHRLLAEAARQKGIQLCWGRVHFVYGPGERPGRLVSSLASALARGEPVDTSEGWQRRDYMHVADVGAAFAALCDCHVAGAVNIATGRVRPVRDIAELLAEAAGRPDLLRIGARPVRPGEPALLEVAVKRLNEEVGFAPSIELERGLSDTLVWWRRHGI